jgi:type IV pilus assembly protein PilV
MNKVPSKNYGFSLLEVLISLVILSVGMMGLAGLKVVAIKGTNEAHFRHEASLLIMDMADRIRANPAGVDNGSYEAHGGISIATDKSPSTMCNNNACDPDELATYDMYSVALNLSRTVPGSSVSITCPSNDCSTTAAIPEGVDAAGLPVPAVAKIKKIHTLEITWKELKQKSEDRTIDDANNKAEFHIRRIKLDIVP